MAAQEYCWKDTDILFSGQLLINVEEAEYKLTADIEVFYGNDGDPSGWGQGETKGEGSITVSGQEYSKIIDFAVAWGWNLLKMPPLPLIIIEKSPDLTTVKHTLSQVKFKEIGWSGKNKDKRYLHKLPFVIVGPTQIIKG